LSPGSLSYDGRDAGGWAERLTKALDQPLR